MGAVAPPPPKRGGVTQRRGLYHCRNFGNFLHTVNSNNRIHGCYKISMQKVKVNQSRLKACSGPESSRKLRFPDFMTTAKEGGKFVSLTHRPPLPQEILLVLIFIRDWVDPRARVRTKVLCQWKIPMTPSRIEPATFRHVAQRLNHCATAVPQNCILLTLTFSLQLFNKI